MQVPIADIKVKRRIRKDLGDVSALAASMKRFGLISPIVLTGDNVLVAGGRRLEAARSLGWRTINAVIVNIPEDLDMLEYEVEENVQRQNFNTEEAAEALRRIQYIQNPGFFRRIWRAIVRFFRHIFKIGG
ncbi:MAG: ParB N-terminal domain-containing protein [Spirochaetaceae bacterium]|jgi:ParB family chromosome partitioning protein|nr:ParB N-terminal domain-containing protein [Spirochaetaceae bacterium]